VLHTNTRGDEKMLKPNLLALAVASVLAGAALAVTARAAETDGAAYVQKAAPATPDAADQSPNGDEAAARKKAQNDATVNLDEIQVTGIRHSIESAIETKQASNSIVEVISSEDLGKLPDISIAESLARLPGLAAQRVAGRAQVITVRGL